MSHCDAIRRHSGGSFHVFDPKQVLVDLCRFGVAKVTAWLGIGETSGGLFKTTCDSNKLELEQLKVDAKQMLLIAPMNFECVFNPKR